MWLYVQKNLNPGEIAIIQLPPTENTLQPHAQAKAFEGNKNRTANTILIGVICFMIFIILN
jgi:hypothetical protein